MLTTRELPIQRAEIGEPYGDQVISTSKDFQTKLHQNEVNDLFDEKLTIKQDKEKYIFAIDNVNKFAVNGKVDFTTFIQDFYKDLAKTEKRDTEKKAVIEVSEFEKKTKVDIVFTETKEDLADLADQIKKNEKLLKKATDIENVKYKIERLIAFFEQEKDLAGDSGSIFNTKYDRKDKELRKVNKIEIKRRIKELNKMKKQIERLANNKDKKYTIDRDIDAQDKKEINTIKEVKMDDTNAMDMKMTLKQFSDRIEDLGKEVPDFILTRNSIIEETGDTTPYFEIIGYGKSDAKKLTKSLKKINNEYAILDELKLTGAKRQELSQDLQDMEKYLSKVINEPNTFKPSEHPFIPVHTKEFFELMKIKPTPEQLKELNKISGKTSTGTTGNLEKDMRGTGKKSDEQFTTQYNDYKEAFEKGGINGLSKYLLDQTHMTSEQKQFWSGAGNIAVAAGGIFLGWKMLSSAYNIVFKSDKKEKTGIYDGSNLARVGIPLGLTFGLNARKGEGLTKLFTGGEITKTIAGAGSSSKETETGARTEKNKTEKEEAQDKENHIKFIEGFPGSTALFNGLKYGEMKSFLIKDGDRIKVDPNQYQALLDIFKSGPKKNPTAAAFLQNSVGKNDERHVIDLTLKAMLGENVRDKLENNPDGDFNTKAAEAIVRLGEVTNLMETKQYDKMNPETQYLIDKYISGENTTSLEDLEKRGDIFYKKIEVVDQTGLADKVKELAKGDAKKEKDLLLAINTFWETMPSGPKHIEIDGTRDAMTFKTYDQTSTINLSKKELVGFTPSRFDSYYEAFKAANLTNRIQDICKDKLAMKKDPFYSVPGMGIFFNDSAVVSTDTDTRVIEKGSLNETSPILEKYQEQYITYLNGLRDWRIAPPNPIVIPNPFKGKEKPAAPEYNGLNSKIDALTTDAAIRKEIHKGINEFYEYMPNADKNVDIDGTLSVLKFTTYGETTTINLTNKNMTGFTPRSFPDYFELFKAASLTNYIKKVCKSKETEKGLPYNMSTGDIAFDAKDGNLDVISGGLFGKLDNVSEVLSSNKQKYIDYLNTTRDRTGNSVNIKAMVGKDQQEAELKILNAMNLFYEKMPSDRKDSIKISGSVSDAVFETYGQTTKIDLNTRAIKNSGIVFPDDVDTNYLELLKAASLTNKIKDIFKNYRAGDNPFNISRPGGDIEFAKTWKIFDIEALTAGRFGNLKDVSPTLEDKKTEYVAYLNNITPKFWINP